MRRISGMRREGEEKRESCDEPKGTLLPCRRLSSSVLLFLAHQKIFWTMPYEFRSSSLRCCEPAVHVVVAVIIKWIIGRGEHQIDEEIDEIKRYEVRHYGLHS